MKEFNIVHKKTLHKLILWLKKNMGFFHLSRQELKIRSIKPLSELLLVILGLSMKVNEPALVL